MPVLNVAFLNPNAAKKGGGSGVGILTDQLTILENQLAKDGNLTAGDYNLLIEKARSIQNMPGLTNDQRSNLSVKVSTYEREQSVANLNRAGDIERMNRTAQDESAQDVMMVGNNPAEFLNGRVASLQAKLNDLQEQIQFKGEAGDDTTPYDNEYRSALTEYQDAVDARDQASKYTDNGAPIPGYAAYVKTNQRGEIIDVSYERYGNKSGYVETSGMINGFQVYGKVNYKSNGRQFFTLGNELFAGSDALLPDPENPGSFKADRLTPTSQQTGGGGVKFGPSSFKNFQPAEIPIQSYVPRNSWAKSADGTTSYFRREDGGYTKHLNMNRSMEGRPDPNDMLTLPKNFESSLTSASDDTVDESAPMIPDTGGMTSLPPNGLMATGQDVQSGQGGAPAPAGMPAAAPDAWGVKPVQTDQVRRTPQQPTERAGAGFMDTAKRTIKSAVDYIRGS